LSRARLHLRGDPVPLAGPPQEFVEQHRLADPTQAVHNPTAVTFAQLLRAPYHHIERRQESITRASAGGRHRAEMDYAPNLLSNSIILYNEIH
jgi:hypothetical protein